MLLFQLAQDVDHRFILLLEVMHDRLHFLFGLGVNQVILLGPSGGLLPLADSATS
jgi:hypothetical protein